MCYPTGQEYMRSHWAIRQLGSQLSRAGLHSMRFDYSGTGDSAGLNSDANIIQWQTDISTALTELKEIAGITRFSLAGLRFGATLAATAPLPNQPVRKLILWDPVVNGRAYIDELRTMQQALLDKLQPLHKSRSHQEQTDTEELIGFRFSTQMVSEIGAIDLLETTEFNGSEISLVVSEERPEYLRLKEHLEGLGLLKSYQKTSPAGEWQNLKEIENALIATESVTAVCNQLTGK